MNQHPHRPASQGVMLRVGLAVFGFLTLAMLLLTLISERGLFAVRGREQQLRSLEEQVSALEAENSAMRDEIGNLNDPHGGEVERRAREELGLIRPGEVILASPSDASGF